jgi:hypothetical protein
MTGTNGGQCTFFQSEASNDEAVKSKKTRQFRKKDKLRRANLEE